MNDSDIEDLLADNIQDILNATVVTLWSDKLLVTMAYIRFGTIISVRISSAFAWSKLP